MTPMAAKKLVARTTTRPAYWRPHKWYQQFMQDSVSEVVAMVLRTPYRSDQITEVLIEGWRHRVRMDQIDPQTQALIIDARGNAAD